MEREEDGMDTVKMLENLNAAVVACDPDFNVTYANPKCKRMFKTLLNMENFVGGNMKDCHKPETMVKLEKLFAEYRQNKRKMDYYTMDVPAGTLTIVNVPCYDADDFVGVVEFIFEGSLA
jgi:nitrogen fixation/metabolism regulation signal transduction histidine kinase